MLFRFGSLTGLSIRATDGEVGRVDDALFDDQRWAMRHLIVDAGTWLGGRKVLIPPVALRMIDWQHDLVQVGLTQQQVEECPSADTAHDPLLRSTNEVTGYRLQTSDGSIVHVEDFLIDTLSWAISYLVVDMQNGLLGKHVVIPPQWITSVDWNERVVQVDVTRRILQAAPGYESSIEFSPAHETSLRRHYHHGGYWQ